MTRNSSRDEGVRAFLRPPAGNSAFYSREYLATVRSCVVKAWPASGPNAAKREVALTLLADPELRLRVCHLEEILRGRQLLARRQANGCSSPNGPTAAHNGFHVSNFPTTSTNGNSLSGASPAYQNGATSPASPLPKDGPPPVLQLQTALADSSFATLFELDSSVNDPDWGMQVLWLNMAHLQKELGLPAPACSTPSHQGTPPPHGTPPQTPSSSRPSSASAAAAAAAPALQDGTALAASKSPPPPSPPLLHLVAPEPQLIHALERAFPHYPTDDEDYLYVATGCCLASTRDPTGLLPPLSLHLPELTTQLCGYAAADGRLAAALHSAAAAAAAAAASHGGAAASILAACLREFLAGPRARLVFRQSESLSRRGESVVSLARQHLTRGGSAGGGGAAAMPRPPSSIGALPLDTWLRAAAAGGGGGGAAGGAMPANDGLPVFLFEYEAPPEAVVRASPASSSRGAAVAGGSPVPARGNSYKPPQPQLQQPQPHLSPAAQLQHARSDGERSLPVFSTNAADARRHTLPYIGLQYTPTTVTAEAALNPAASEPVPLSDSVLPHPPPPLSADVSAAPSVAASLQRRMTEPAPVFVAAGGNNFAAGSDHNLGGFHRPYPSYPGLGLNGVGSDLSITPSQIATADEGTSIHAAGSYNQQHGVRFPTYDNRAADAVLQHNLASASAAQASLLSPSAATGERTVPQAIADVWLNAAFGGGGGASGVREASWSASRRGSMTVNGTMSSSGLAGDVSALGGIFAMSPTHEQSHIWERVAARSHQSSSQPSASATGNGVPNDGPTDRSGGVDLSGFGLGLPGFSGASGNGSLIVGSAPPGIVPPFLYGNGIGIGNGNSHGFIPRIDVGNGGASTGLNDYVSWHSSSADVSTSVGGRSAPADDLPGGSWLLAHGARTGGGCGGGGAAAAAADRMFATAAAVAGTADAAMTGPGGGVVGNGPSPRLSEESDEAASVVGGLDLDPVAMTLEFIGLNQAEPGVAAGRRGFAAASPDTNAVQARGLIAAAAAPKAPDAGTANATPIAAKSFASAAASATPAANGVLTAGTAFIDGASPHSSLDSADALPGGGGTTATVLTGWSAMAARGPPPPGSAAATAAQVQGMQLAAAAAAANSRLAAAAAAPQMQPANAAVVQGLAATMVAMGPLAAAGLTPMGSLLGVPGLGSGSAGTAASAAAARDALFGGKGLHPKLTPRVREEIFQLVRSVPGLKAEDFDDGVLHQLTLKKSEDEAVGALRTLAAENLSGIQHMAAYINHIIKNYHITAAGVHGAGAPGLTAASLPSATVRANSTPVSSKAILQKLPLRVYRRLEEVISKCPHMEWKHFDAGVVKVMAQLAEIGEEDVFEELELLKSTDLSNVEYMPAYLNKRLNNRLWSRRKMLTSAVATVAGP